VIRLLFAMVSVRRNAALTVLVLAAVAAAAAAAGPFYRSAARDAATSVEVSAAPPEEQTIRRSYLLHRDKEDPSFASQDSTQRPPQPSQADFDTVAGLQTSGRATQGAAGPQAVAEQLTVDTGPAPAAGPVPASLGTAVAPVDGAWLTYRSSVCRHLIVVTGRCVSGAHEVVLSVRTAAALHLNVGDALSFEPGIVTDGSFQSDGPPTSLTMVGIYQPRAAGEPYWAGRAFVTSPNSTRFADDAAQTADAMFASRETVLNIPFLNGVETVDFIAHRSAFDNPDALRAIIADDQLQAAAQRYAVDTSITDLLDRAATNRQSLADGVQLAALPLVLLCWFVLYLAVANSTFRRRGEFGLAGLRGVPRGTRWWLGAAEYAMPLLVGAPLGYLGGYLIVALLAGRLLPGDPRVVADPDSVIYAAVAVGGALLVGLVAQWRATAAPVAMLLRRVPTRRLVTRFGPVEAIVVALTVAAGYQIRSGGARTGGLAMLAPLLVALAVGLLAARLAGLVADRAGRRALRNGSLGRALATFTLARQPGQARLLALLVMVFAVLGFAVTAADVAEQARAARVRTELGATRVLAVKSLPARTLLAAVRTADPDGRYAMATGLAGTTAQPVLAVDTTRLAKVATWDREYKLTPQRVTQMLRPRDPTELRLTGSGVEVRATVSVGQMQDVRLFARLLPEQRTVLRVELGALRPGTTAYRAAVPDCAQGCRLLALELAVPSTTRFAVDFTLHEVRQNQPDAMVAGGTDLADPGRWGGQVNTNEAPLTATPIAGTDPAGAGLRLSYTGPARPQTMIIPVGTPRPVPVLSTGALEPTMSATGSRIPITQVGTLPLVPGYGAPSGDATVVGLADLSYVDLADPGPGDLRDPKVWLAANTPSQVVDRLHQAGLVIITDQTARHELTLLDQRGPALALRFYLFAAIASVALGVGGLAVIAAADRAGQAEALRALRVQGLPSRIPWQVGLGGYAVLAAIAAVTGSLATVIAWWLTRAVIPMFTSGGESLYAPAAPHPIPVLGALLAAVAVLVAAGAVAAAGLRRAVEGGGSRA
jgi:putative ABC transport system permease protein